MTACERCWQEYSRRKYENEYLNYSDVVAERDAEGGCTPEEQCGEMHLLVGDSCRCGKFRALTKPEGE